MDSLKSKSLYACLFFFLLSFYLMSLTTYPKIDITKQDSAFNLNQDILKIASLGQKRMLADILWVKTLLESDLEHYSKKDLSSWMYLRFKSIAELDPKFYENYLYGGQYLMIVKDDIPGAEKILTKGAEFYPNDYHLNFTTGYLYALEIGNLKKSLIYYERIKDAPQRPQNFDSFLAKIMNESLGREEALLYSIESLKRTPEDTPIFKKIRSNIYSLRASLDLECLNSRDNKNCNRLDYFNTPYLYKNGSYTSKFKAVDMKLKYNK